MKCLFAVDEIESASRLLHNRFQRDSDKPMSLFGLLFPLAKACSTLQGTIGFHLVFMGTGTSREQIDNLKSTVGKTPGDVLNMFTQSDFPMASADHVQAGETCHLLPRASTAPRLSAALLRFWPRTVPLASCGVRRTNTAQIK